MKTAFRSFLVFLSFSLAQESISYDISNQFGYQIKNNLIQWNNDQEFENILVDRSSKNFTNKFHSFNFNEFPADSIYTKSKFIYEFGDYGFDALNIGLKKNNEMNSFQFFAGKKSFFGNYSEFSDEDGSPLSLFYKFDFSVKVKNHSVYTSAGYFREKSNFRFNNPFGLDSSNNKEFSDFISLKVGDAFKINDNHYNIELNHISKFDSINIAEYNLNNRNDLKRNLLNMEVHNGRWLHLKAVIDNNYYMNEISSKGFSTNLISLSNKNNFSVGDITYGVDFLEDDISPKILINNSFGIFNISVQSINKPNRVLNDLFSYQVIDEFSGRKLENWNSVNIGLNIDKKVSISSHINFTQANDIAISQKPLEMSVVEDDIYLNINDNITSLETSISFPIKFGQFDITHYYNFYDSAISSNRSHSLNLEYLYNLSLVSNKLGIEGKIGLQYFSENDSDYYFDYFRDIPVKGKNYVLDDFYNLYLKMDVSISDVILTIRLKNGLYKFFEEDDYSPVNHELFNPVSSLLSFGIIWEFDD